MGLVYKQLSKQIVKDKILLSLLFLLTILTSLSFFFVMFSIDGNMAVLNTLDGLTENQQLYKNALNSNTTLAYTFFISLMGLSAFVFVMFFYRFFRANKKQIGCIKALGFKDSILQIYFIAFTAILSFGGAIFGMIGGYFLSDVLINANSQTYAVTDLTKNVGIISVLIGVVVSTAIFSIVAFLCYGFVRNKEAGFLLAGNNEQIRFSAALLWANKISKIAPAENRLSLRIALRKPISILLIFVAVTSFSVCIILGQSLNISSEKVFSAQTIGHNYEYDTHYSEYQVTDINENTMTYLESPATFSIGNYKLERTVTGLYHSNKLYELKNRNNELLATPEAGTIYINPELSEIYGVEIGDTMPIVIKGSQHTFIVKDMAVNAKSKSIYINGRQLTDILDIPAGAYNGMLSSKEIPGVDVITKTQRIDYLRRNAVSNNTSAVINQTTGILIGAVLIFLALFINFQDNTHDIVILNMIGHRIKYIRKILIDVYLPILWTAFIVTLVPSIFIAKTIQRSLSISTNDYMPFGTNIIVFLVDFCLISLIYWGVQITFNSGIKRVITKREITDIIYVD
ncbi:FtsX-like permease family protein [Bacilliculturomica massiliensis]|uniref:FtsX-like permease family protein n=1 Tax=Bacilliculturomica massiliensis TaxID=1917867 RepID=UPI0013EF3D17|nr:ABC transporter permease [Bacilliculturomica massiliensis]